MDLPPVPYKLLAWCFACTNDITCVALCEVPRRCQLSLLKACGSNIPSLDHELLDNAVEGGAPVPEALLAGSKGAEILSSLGDGLAVETDGDAAELFIAVGDVEVDLV